MEEEFIVEFNVILHQEAVFWQQKSGLKWLQEGERNAKFFHLTTIIRRRRNKIEGLLNDQGELVVDYNELQLIAMGYFHNLFSHRKVSN